MKFCDKATLIKFSSPASNLRLPLRFDFDHLLRLAWTADAALSFLLHYTDVSFPAVDSACAEFSAALIVKQGSAARLAHGPQNTIGKCRHASSTSPPALLLTSTVSSHPKP